MKAVKVVKKLPKPKFLLKERCPKCNFPKLVIPVELEQDDEGLWVVYHETCQNEGCDYCKVYKAKFYPAERKFIC